MWVLGNIQRILWAPHCANLMHSDLADADVRIPPAVYAEVVTRGGSRPDALRHDLDEYPDIRVLPHMSGVATPDK